MRSMTYNTGKKMLEKSKNLSLGTTLNVGMSGVGGVIAYNDARSEGKGVLPSAAEAAFSTALWGMIGWKATIGIVAGQLAYEGGKAVVNMGIENDRKYQRAGAGSPFATSTFVDSQQAYTMRQAGMTQIQQNVMNTKKALLGNEAMHMHR